MEQEGHGENQARPRVTHARIINMFVIVLSVRYVMIKLYITCITCAFAVVFLKTVDTKDTSAGIPTRVHVIT
jgi:hypothetical protein